MTPQHLARERRLTFKILALPTQQPPEVGKPYIQHQSGQGQNIRNILHQNTINPLIITISKTISALENPSALVPSGLSYLAGRLASNTVLWSTNPCLSRPTSFDPSIVKFGNGVGMYAAVGFWKYIVLAVVRKLLASVQAHQPISDYCRSAIFAQFVSVSHASGRTYASSWLVKTLSTLPRTRRVEATRELACENW